MGFTALQSAVVTAVRRFGDSTPSVSFAFIRAIKTVRPSVCAGPRNALAVPVKMGGVMGRLDGY